MAQTDNDTPQWVWPVWGQPAYGPRISSEYRSADRPSHIGMDIAIPVGTKILAPISGTVKLLTDKFGWGRHVEITSGPFRIILGHLSAFASGLVNGQTVKAGQMVALSGGAVDDEYAGSSTGPHLDITIYSDNTPHNPREYFGGTFGTQTGEDTGTVTDKNNDGKIDSDIIDKIKEWGKNNNTEIGNKSMWDNIQETLIGTINRLLGVPEDQTPSEYIKSHVGLVLPRAFALVLGVGLIYMALRAALTVGNVAGDVSGIAKNPIGWTVTHPKKAVKMTVAYQAYKGAKQTITKATEKPRVKEALSRASETVSRVNPKPDLSPAKNNGRTLKKNVRTVKGK